jgi:hypothetical protein
MYNIKGDSSTSVWTTAMLKVNKKRVLMNSVMLRWSNLVSKAIQELKELGEGGAALKRWAELYQRSCDDEEVSTHDLPLGHP